MSAAPIGWRVVKLGAIADDVTVGHVGSMAHEYRDRGVPFLRSQNVLPHRFDLTDVRYIDSEFHAKLKKSSLHPGDVITVRTGKPGVTAVVPDGWVSANCSDVVITRPGSEIDSYWLSYFINNAVSGFVSSRLVGAVQQHFNVGSARDMDLLLPTMSEQKAIAGVLRALDDKIAANLTALETADSLACALFLQARLGSPESEFTYEQIADVSGGGTPRTAVAEYWDGDVSWATPTDVTALNAPYLRSTSRMITDDGLANCSSRLFEAGSILMTSRATIGAFAIAENAMAVNQGFIVVNAKDPRHQWWLFHEMRSRVPEFISHANGATFLELPRGRFKSLPVALPDEAVLAKFDAEAKSLHSAASGADKESRKLKEIRDVLLPHLMSGKLRVRNAEKVVEAVL
ncbi:restriction endonuclease subunit S [Rhodococcus erythropolis]|uniref:restriction endonuclease subunit S n=1 Tax=Rhodococcus erythropolis TaxID=1833 RepID=UPI0009BF5AB9|nr:restriction endonuclease subunit S [Rhodococcus erythropolis]